MKILCVSDIHLGSPVCKADKLLKLLEEPWTEIIINGDLMDSGHFKRYTKKHWEVLKTLRKLSKKIPVRLIEGNHDENSFVLCDILGLDFVQNHKVFAGERIIWFEHGHRFDFFIKKHPFLTEIASQLYYLIQRLDTRSVVCSRIKKSSKSWLDASRVVADRALKFAKNEGFTDIVCGHVHQHGIVDDGVRYWNTGTFCDSPSFYLVIEGGEISLRSV